jgi:lipopolysaccharide/colanic/teichoic acid biosynthesis glycosyltransferase
MEQGVQVGVIEHYEAAGRVSHAHAPLREGGSRLHSHGEHGRAVEEERSFGLQAAASEAGSSRVVETMIRLMDVAGSLVMLVAAFPVMLLVALLVKLTSRGPVLYKQERVGRGGKIFSLYKFRTMVEDAEKHVGPVWAARDDARVTPVGRVLRRTRLDELPQVYNILRGDMSLVGPRPERPYFVARHAALQGRRLSVKPGLTGLAQVRSFYDLKPAHKVRYDHLYIQNRSLLLNIYILLQTIPALFAKKGW